MSENQYIISTNHQKVLSFLTKFSDEEYYEREIARKIGISFGSANQVLNDLFRAGFILRRLKGNVIFYKINQEDPFFKYFKILTSIVLLRPLLKKLERITKKIVLFGSCAYGTDTSTSDIDLFIISDEKEKTLRIIKNFTMNKGFEDIIIEPAVFSPPQLLESEKTDNEFLSLVREGIVLWDKIADESGV